MTEEMKNVTPETAEAPEHVETMEDYKEELEASFKQIHEGDILTGTVIGVSESAITLDLKYYTDGIIRLEDFTNDPNFNLAEDIHVGDEISATVIRRDDGEGHILLSAKEANEVLAWDKLRKYKEEGTNLKVKIAGIVKSGVVAYLEGIRGFIPASKLDLNYVEEDALNDWLGKEIEASCSSSQRSRIPRSWTPASLNFPQPMRTTIIWYSPPARSSARKLPRSAKPKSPTWRSAL